MCIVQRPHSEDSTGARPNMTSVFDFDDSINTVYNAKTAGKNLVTAKHEVLTKAGDFLFLAHSDRELEHFTKNGRFVMLIAPSAM